MTKHTETAARQDLQARTRVVFHMQDGPGGADDIFVAVNGQACLIKRECEVALPPEVLEVVENARQTIFEPENGVARARQVPRFAYTVLGPAARAEA